VAGHPCKRHLKGSPARRIPSSKSLDRRPPRTLNTEGSLWSLIWSLTRGKGHWVEKGWSSATPPISALGYGGRRHSSSMTVREPAPPESQIRKNSLASLDCRRRFRVICAPALVGVCKEQKMAGGRGSAVWAEVVAPFSSPLSPFDQIDSLLGGLLVG
jgi:hypothetical protein